MCLFENKAVVGDGWKPKTIHAVAFCFNSPSASNENRFISIGLDREEVYGEAPAAVEVKSRSISFASISIVEDKFVNVIIVDDSTEIRTLFKEIFSEYPEIHLVADTDDVSEALLSVCATHPDYVILDISMPKGSGFTLLEEIRSRNISSKVIMCTNYSAGGYRTRAKDLGADYFFDKSTEFEKIIGVITASLAVSSEQWAVISEQLWVNSNQWAVISEQLSVNSYQWAVISEQ